MSGFRDPRRGTGRNCLAMGTELRCCFTRRTRPAFYSYIFISRFRGRKDVMGEEMEKMDHIEVANSKSLQEFTEEYMPSSDEWRTWIYPATKAEYQITLQIAQALTQTDFDACFHLIEHTSAEAYRKSKDGWKPRSKRKEMKLLDLKYLLVKLDNQIQGFVSFMPTYEDEYPVIYCYEIHLSSALQGSGLGRVLMQYLDVIGERVPGTVKVMLTCFTSNIRGVAFYEKLGYAKDKFSPPPRILRNGTKVEADYVILSKNVSR